MRRFHRYGPDLGRHGRFPMRGGIWMVGLGLLLFSGRLWPLFLIVIGIALVYMVVQRGSAPQAPFGQQTQQPSYTPAPPVVITQPAPASPAPHPDVLPGNCPRCGAPVRPLEVKWSGAHTAACSYCGSTLTPLKN